MNSTTPEGRLAALNLELPEATAPIATFVPTVQTGELLFVSGQVTTAADGLVASGRLGAEQHVVANAPSDLLQEVLGSAGAHSRSAIGVAAVPLGSPVEVEVER